VLQIKTALDPWSIKAKVDLETHSPECNINSSLNALHLPTWPTLKVNIQWLSAGASKRFAVSRNRRRLGITSALLIAAWGNASSLLLH
jgi:hypothetical protein